MHASGSFGFGGLNLLAPGRAARCVHVCVRVCVFPPPWSLPPSVDALEHEIGLPGVSTWAGLGCPEGDRGETCLCLALRCLGDTGIPWREAVPCGLLTLHSPSPP